MSSVPGRRAPRDADGELRQEREPTRVLHTDGHLDIGFIALLAGLAVLPLYPKVGLISISGTYIPVRIDDFVTLGIVAAWALTLFRDRRRPRIPIIAVPVLVWLVLGLCALAIGAGVLGTVRWGTGFLFWAKPIEYLVLGWIAYDLVDRPQRLRPLLAVIVLTASVVVAYAVLERFDWLPHAPNYATDVSLLRALGSTMGDSHQLATYLGLVTLLGIATWHRLRGRARAAGLVGLVAAAYVIVHAAGRSEFVSLALGTGLLTLWKPSRIPALVMLGALVVLFSLPSAVEGTLETAFANRNGPAEATPAPSAVATPWTTYPPDTSGAPVTPTPPPVTVSERFEGLNEDRSLQIRLEERWPVFIALGMRNPLLGAGPSAATEAADGYYVRSFTEVGIAGSVAFLAIILSVMAALWRVLRSRVPDAQASAAGLLAGTIFVALVGILIDTWVASRAMQLYWPAVGATLAGLASLRQAAGADDRIGLGTSSQSASPE